MKSGVILAICASLVLVGGASWSRYERGGQTAGLMAVTPEQSSQDYYDNLVTTYLNVATTTSDSAPLTTTDLLGRQMIIDYLDLTETGQDSEENLEALAEKYIEAVPNLVPSVSKTFFDLKITSNTTENFAAYATEIQDIYRDYASALLTSSPNPESFSLSPQHAAIAQKMSAIYQNAADRLIKLSIPAEVAQAHLDLVNIYLQNAAAAKAIATVTSDPASSFAGLLAFKENAQKEKEILGNIEDILTNNGV